MAASVYTRYYLQQSGRGHADSRFGSAYISPYVLQRGYGLGGILSTAARYLTPIFGALKDTAITAGKNALHDIGRKSFGQILTEQGKLAASTLTDRSAKQLHEWIGAGRGPRTRSATLKSIKRRAVQAGGISSMAKRARTSASTSRKRTKKRTKRRTKTVAVGAGRQRKRGARKAKKTRKTRRKRTLDIFS